MTAPALQRSSSRYSERYSARTSARPCSAYIDHRPETVDQRPETGEITCAYVPALCSPPSVLTLKAAALVASLLGCQRNPFPTSQRGPSLNRVSKVTTDRARVTSRWTR